MLIRTTVEIKGDIITEKKGISIVEDIDTARVVQNINAAKVGVQEEEAEKDEKIRNWWMKQH